MEYNPNNSRECFKHLLEHNTVIINNGSVQGLLSQLFMKKIPFSVNYNEKGLCIFSVN